MSRFSRRDVHLFLFRRQGQTWRYSTSDRNRAFGGFTYLGAGSQIERDAIRETSESAKDRLKIRLAHVLDPAAAELPVTQSLGGLWRPYIPSDPISVVCMTAQIGSATPPRVEWMGEVSGAAYSDVEVELSCEQGNGYERARNQGAKWGRGCWKTPYSTGPRGCNLDPEEFRVSGVATTVDGLVVTSPAFAASTFSLRSGAVSWVGPAGVVEERVIVAHDGDTVKLLYSGAGLAPGVALSALPSCEQNWTACSLRRPDPELHYGGAIYKPAKSPMNGESMSWG